MKFFLFLFCTFLYLFPASAQNLQGIVLDNEEQPLAFASIYVKGTSTGTSTNMQGRFSLNLAEGTYEISIRYVGYQTKNISIEVKEQDIFLSIYLVPESLVISEVVVRAEGEDPAYGIIRRAMEKRDYYLNHVEKLSCHTYIKGTYYMIDRPDFFLGMELDDSFFISSDSFQHPIVYLAETETRYFKMAPNLRREIVKSTRASGDSRGFAFNSALLMDINLYESEVSLMTKLKSPIGRGAFGYYDYRLDGSTMGADGKMINKIELVPKNPRGPVFSGYIYIRDESWNIIEADLYITGNNIQNSLLDTMRLKQVHIPLGDDKWVVFQQNLEIRVSLMGFVISGGFTGVFSEYNLNPDIDRNFFRAEIIGFDPEFNQRSLLQWDSLRPIPLIDQEQWDFKVKDSIEAVRNDPVFIDSMDREFNKFKGMDIITGYQFRKRNNHFSGTLASPLSDLNFNAVKGFHTNIRAELSKQNLWVRNDELKTEFLVNYGFSSRSFQPQMRIHFLKDPIKRSNYTLSLGRKLTQFYEEQDIPEGLNTMYSLLRARNYARYFQKDYLKFQASSRPIRWLSYNFSVEYASRSFVDNNTNYSYRKNSSPYEENIPYVGGVFNLESHSVLKSSVRFNFFPGARFVSFPDSRFYLNGSIYPRITIGLDGGKYIEGESGSYLRIIGGLAYSRSLSTWGISSMRWVGGFTPMGPNNLNFVDQKHFLANEALFLLSEDINRGFLALPHYQYSTSGTFMEVHYEHNFGAKILGNIPGIRWLGWHWQTGYKLLKTEDRKPYSEMFVGFNNIGVGPIRIFRLDGVFVFRGSEFDQSYLRISASLPIDRQWFY